MKEYLLDLKETLSKHLKTKVIDVQIENVVHIGEANQKRNKWCLVVIERVIKTFDGENRLA